MIYAQPGTVFEAVASGFAPNLVGTIGVRIRDNQGADALARTTAGIAQDLAVGGNAIYRTNLVAPAVAGQFTIIWDDGVNVASEDLVIQAVAPGPAQAPSPYSLVGHGLTSFAQIFNRVKLLTDSLSEPVLADVEVAYLVGISKRVDLFGIPPDDYDEWAPSTNFAIGNTIVPTGRRGDPMIPIVRNGFYYTCTVGGASGVVEPVWPVVVGAVIADGTVTWSCTGVAPWNPRYDVYYGIAQGWLLKSSRLAGHYNFMTGGKMLSRQQFYDHCMDQYKLYARKSGIKGVRLGGHSVLGMDMGTSVPTNADG